MANTHDGGPGRAAKMLGRIGIGCDSPEPATWDEFLTRLDTATSEAGRLRMRLSSGHADMSRAPGTPARKDCIVVIGGQAHACTRGELEASEAMKQHYR